MNSPTFIAIFGAFFVVLGSFNASRGFRKLQAAQTRGEKVVWYKEMNVLLGFEYFLLGLVFLTSSSNQLHWLPASLVPIITPVYLFLLLTAAILAGLVIRQAMANARQTRQMQRARAQVQQSEKNTAIIQEKSPQQKSDIAQRQRERRQKAAATRRRRTGRS